MIRRDVEGRTSIAFCGGLTGRRWAPADPIRRRSGRDRNDDMGRDGCPRALDLHRVVGRGDRRAVASAVRHRRGGAGRWVAGWVAWAGARVLRGGPDRGRAVPGGGRGGDRLSGDRAIQDAASVGRSQQVRPPGHRPAVASADGRRADTGHGPVSHVRGGEGPGEGARAGQARPDALPASALEAAVAPRLRVGPHGVDSDAPSVALSTDLRASEHRAGVHRQPRRLRRADRPPASARRAALLGRAGPGVLAAGPPLARVPRPGHALGADRRARGRRLHQVPPRGAARIVARASALAPAVRGVRRARVDHQDRLEVRPADPGRGRLALRPSAEDRPDARRAPGGAARPRPADRLTRPTPPLPDPPPDARTQEARQRDHRRMRARARLLPLGRCHRSIAQTDSPLPLGWGGAGPRSPLARAALLWAALTRPRPLLDTRSPATEPGTWGSQPDRKSPTEVENFARRLPTRANFHQPPNGSSEGSMNAAHLTNVPPYEQCSGRWCYSRLGWSA